MPLSIRKSLLGKVSSPMSSDIAAADIFLAHGLGANGAVWQTSIPQFSALTSGSVVSIDLPGHGEGPSLSDYSLGEFTAALSSQISARHDRSRPLIVIGHSLGGTLALMLATHFFSVKPARVFAVGVKVNWTKDELERFEKLADRPTKTFGSADDAKAFFARVAGLTEAQAATVDLTSGVRSTDDQWRLAQDPGTNIITPPPMTEFVSLAKCPFHLACGTEDQMVNVEQLRKFDPSAVAFPQAGHNVMVETPGALLDWVKGATGL